MSLIRPFPARIVRQEQATNVVCPMHDALSPAQRANLLLENPLSYLNVTRSALDMPGDSFEELGAANAEGLERLLRSGAYGDLWQPALYLYRISQNGEEHTGIVADLDVSGFVVHSEPPAAPEDFYRPIDDVRRELLTHADSTGS